MLNGPIGPATPPPQGGLTAPEMIRLRQAAEELEASFLSEMLKAAGLDGSPSSFGGGAGDSQFASFLRDEQARQMVQAGGLGLAETFFHALKERDHD